MKKRLAAATIAAALSIGLMVPAASAAGEPSLSCDIGGVTALKGPVPKDATTIWFTWYTDANWQGAIVSQQWLGGKKRFPTPSGYLSVAVDFYSPDGTQVFAVCLP